MNCSLFLTLLLSPGSIDGKTECNSYSEQYRRKECYATETRNRRLVYLARVWHIEEPLAERDQEYLRYEHAGEQHHQRESKNVNNKPCVHSYSKVIGKLNSVWPESGNLVQQPGEPPG